MRVILSCVHSDGKTVHDFDKFKNPVDLTLQSFGYNTLRYLKVSKTK